MQVRIYKITSAAIAAVKKVLEAPEDFKETEPGKREFVTNPYARNGYVMRDGASLNMESGATYLYVKGEDDFFAKNEKNILIEGVTKLAGADLDKAKQAIESEQANAEAGMGAVFGDF